ncbi:biotin/lipoyl-containing protein [Cupriavidus basilensis]
MAIDIAAGKTLLISLQGSHPDAEAGNIKVQFELNGQSRTAVVEQRTTTLSRSARVRGAAPLPTPTIRCISLRRCSSSIVTVAVQPGQKVAAGTTLLALEAMKMETHIPADRDCEIATVYVKQGDRGWPRRTC